MESHEHMMFKSFIVGAGRVSIVYGGGENNIFSLKRIGFV